MNYWLILMLPTIIRGLFELGPRQWFDNIRPLIACGPFFTFSFVVDNNAVYCIIRGHCIHFTVSS